jgi:hypothetical protein
MSYTDKLFPVDRRDKALTINAGWISDSHVVTVSDHFDEKLEFVREQIVSGAVRLHPGRAPGIRPRRPVPSIARAGPAQETLKG